jgi:hypothetical protein
VPFSIYFIPKEAKGGKTKIPSCFLPPILLLSFYSLGLILFNFVSPSSRIRKRPGRLNRSRKKKRKNTEGRTPGFPLLRWNEEEELFLLHKTAPPTSYSTHVRTRCIIFIFFERKEKEDVE